MIEKERIEKLSINSIQSQKDVQNVNQPTVTETTIIEEEKLESEFSKTEEKKQPATKKPSIVSSWMEKIGKWAKEDNDFTDI